MFDHINRALITINDIPVDISSLYASGKGVETRIDRKDQNVHQIEALCNIVLMMGFKKEVEDDSIVTFTHHGALSPQETLRTLEEFGCSIEVSILPWSGTLELQAAAQEHYRRWIPPEITSPETVSHQSQNLPCEKLSVPLPSHIALIVLLFLAILAAFYAGKAS